MQAWQSRARVALFFAQNSSLPCTELNYALDNLAPQFPHVCFVRIRANEAIPGALLVRVCARETASG